MTRPRAAKAALFGARPTSLGGGRARLSAAAGAWGGGVSPPDLPLSGGSGFGADRRLRHACEVSSGSALAPLAVALDRSAVRGARLSGEGCPGGGRGQRPPPGSRGPAVPKVGAQQPLIG